MYTIFYFLNGEVHTDNFNSEADARKIAKALSFACLEVQINKHEENEEDEEGVCIAQYFWGKEREDWRG